MKRLLLLAAVLFAAFTMQAQRVNVQEETIKMTKKMHVAGYSVNLTSVDDVTVEEALKAKFEKDNKMKGSKGDGGFRAYLSQPFTDFGTSNYDIYWKVEKVGKKDNTSVDVKMIVSSGNMNTITSRNDPETAAKVKIFLTDFVKYVNNYSLNQELNTLNGQLEKLNNEKKSLLDKQAKSEKDIEKLQKDIEKEQKEIEGYKKQVSDKDASIKELENQINAVKKQL